MADDNAVRHALLALMLATGRFSEPEMQSATGLAPTHMDILQRSPLFLNSVEQFRERLKPADPAVALEEDAADNVEWLRRVRRGDEATEDPRSLRLRLNAATTLLDRQVPRAASAAERAAGAGVTIVIDERTAQRIASARAERVVELPAPDEPETDGD